MEPTSNRRVEDLLLTDTKSSLQYNTTDDSISHSVEDYIEKRLADNIHLFYVPVCVFLGMLGNTVSLYVFVMTPLRKTTTCLYMATISCMDNAILLIDLLLYLERFQVIRGLFNWEYACGLLMFIFLSVGHYDVLLLVSMTAERYVAVRFPLQATTLLTRRKATIVMVSLAVFSVSVNCYHLLPRIAVWDQVSRQTVCQWNGEKNVFLADLHAWIDSTMYCFIPLISLSVLNSLIIWNLRIAAKSQHAMTKYENTTAGSRSNTEIQSQGQRQVTRMLILVSGSFLVMTLPIAVRIIIRRYIWFPESLHDLAVSFLISAISNNLMYTNHAVNFFLYCVSGHRFRTELKQLCCRRQHKHRPNRVPCSNRTNEVNVDSSSTTTTTPALSVP